MAWTAPATATVGQILTAAFMNAQLRDNMLLTAPSLVTTDGDIVVATAANTLKRLAAFSGDVLLQELGAWELDISALTTNDTVGGASAGVAEIKVPMTQAEAEAGTGTRFSLVSPQRIKQAIDAGSQANIATGSYTGDGTTSQAITGVGFTVKEVQIWFRETTPANTLVTSKVVMTTDVIIDDDASGGSIQEGGAAADAFQDDQINALGSDGFTVDDNAIDDHPNANLVVYNFRCLG